jgi:hypothetical protein
MPAPEGDLTLPPPRLTAIASGLGVTFTELSTTEMPTWRRRIDVLCKFLA